MDVEKTVCSQQLSLEEYLDRCLKRELITNVEKDRAIDLWNKIVKLTNDRIVEPDAAPGGDKSLMIAIDFKKYHMEFEFCRNNPIEVFFFDRETDKVWETVIDEEMNIAQSLMDKINLFM